MRHPLIQVSNDCTSFYGRFPILGNHRWERAFPLKLAFAIDCVAKSAPLGLLEGNRACST